jgi:hypothetical protein
MRRRRCDLHAAAYVCQMRSRPTARMLRRWVSRMRRLERKETCPICDTPMSFEELLA